MAYDVLIRRNADGAERLCHQDLYWTDDASQLYWWTDGNYGCDCNRHDEFELAGGREIDDLDTDSIPCGTERYTAIKAILPDGREVLIDKP